MPYPTDSMPPNACPASAAIMATRLARTPLAMADAHAPGAPILLANDAFAALVGVDPAALKGRPLRLLSTTSVLDVAHRTTTRFELAAQGASLPAALSIAPVPGPDGRPFCLLCSLIDARGDDADAAIARDAHLLAQVAQAAGDLMRGTVLAASPHESSSFAAVDHVTRETDKERA